MRQTWGFTVLVLVLVLAHSEALAHEIKAIGKIRLTIGWGDEPALSGLKNSVDVEVSDAAGAPVVDPDAALAVEIAFGDERIVRPLLPAGERPGRYRAWLVPTRSGTYTFHITGKVKGQGIDTTSVCSDKTFDCVTDASELHFPARDPSAGQLAESVTRALPRAERAMSQAAAARYLGVAAMAVASLALVTAIALHVRKGSKGA